MKSVKLTALLFILCTSLFGQSSDFVANEGITSALHKSNIGKITFMGQVIPIEKYQESDFLKSFELKEKVDLNIRTFLGNSLTNYLHNLAPELTSDELTRKGNYQFRFYVDSILIYTENLNPGAGSADSKSTRTVFRVPLISSKNEDSWGRFLWYRFTMNGGQEALNEGVHLLKIEIRPYLQTTELKTGSIIAEGQIQIILPQTTVDEKQIAIQPIKPKSGWEVSKDHFNTEKIRSLNQSIADGTFKEITSIIVIKNGQLLIEEYFNGASRNTLHDTRSVGKSFASALTGLAIQDGFIKDENQQLKDFYTLKQFQNHSTKKDSVTIKNLLTMTSAFDGSDMNPNSAGNEENMYPTSNWVNFTLNLKMDSTIRNGQSWDYFTAGVILIGDILNKAVPDGLEKYASNRLLKPLGIEKYKWQYTPQNVANTAGGLQMKSLDYAKFGQLYKAGGSWNGVQIISKNWVEKSLSEQISIPDAVNEYYGYLFWNKTYLAGNGKYEVYYSSGNGGNKIFIFKDNPFVVVVTSTAYNKPYCHAQVDKIVKHYLIPAILQSTGEK